MVTICRINRSYEKFLFMFSNHSIISFMNFIITHNAPKANVAGIVFFFLLFLSPSIAFADIMIGGPTTLDQSGATYRLTKDISAPGTAFTITANDVTLDLGGHTVEYNALPSTYSVYGVYVNTLVNHVTIKNGTIMQGAGGSSTSPAIYIYGGTNTGNHEISYLIIRVYGYQCNGIEAGQGYSFNNSKIHHTYIEVRSDTDAIDGYGSDPIVISADTGGGIEIYENFSVGGHRGIYAVGIGKTQSNPSKIYKNKIQQERRKGSKAPYGIILAGPSHNVSVYENQIVSDNGRGIILDGYGQGVLVGASGNYVYNNIIDVQYSESASQGQYVENNVYGIRDRYSSGDNIIKNNTIIVTNDVDGELRGLYIGSDSSDILMKNISVSQNKIIARKGKGNSTPYAFFFEWAESVTVENNLYLTDGNVNNSGYINSLTFSNNTPLTISPSSTILAPSGLKIEKCFESYLLQWNKNAETDIFEYVVYRDGAKLPISPRGGTFFVDIDIVGDHVYSVSALTLSGVEGQKSANVLTTTAAKCLDSIMPPQKPVNLRVE